MGKANMTTHLALTARETALEEKAHYPGEAEG